MEDIMAMPQMKICGWLRLAGTNLLVDNGNRIRTLRIFPEVGARSNLWLRPIPPCHLLIELRSWNSKGYISLCVLIEIVSPVWPKNHLVTPSAAVSKFGVLVLRWDHHLCRYDCGFGVWRAMRLVFKVKSLVDTNPTLPPSDWTSVVKFKRINFTFKVVPQKGLGRYIVIPGHNRSQEIPQNLKVSQRGSRSFSSIVRYRDILECLMIQKITLLTTIGQAGICMFIWT